MITCRELVDFIMDYDDGQLSPIERQEFELHLAYCHACVAYLKSYRETVRLGRAAFADPGASVPAAVPEDLVKAILSARKRKGEAT